MSEGQDTQAQRPVTAAAPHASGAWAIELEKINKSFGAVHANKDIDLAVPGNRVINKPVELRKLGHISQMGRDITVP